LGQTGGREEGQAGRRQECYDAHPHLPGWPGFQSRQAASLGSAPGRKMAGQEREWSAYDRQQPGLSINGPGSTWKPVRVFNKDAVPVPLTSDALSAAQAYAGRNQPGAVHRAGGGRGRARSRRGGLPVNELAPGCEHTAGAGPNAIRGRDG
jgi:hypothetical protein